MKTLNKILFVIFAFIFFVFVVNSLNYKEGIDNMLDNNLNCYSQEDLARLNTDIQGVNQPELGTCFNKYGNTPLSDNKTCVDAAIPLSSNDSGSLALTRSMISSIKTKRQNLAANDCPNK